METCQWHSIILHFHAFIYPHYKNASFIKLLNNVIVFAVQKYFLPLEGAIVGYNQQLKVHAKCSSKQKLHYLIIYSMVPLVAKIHN